LHDQLLALNHTKCILEKHEGGRDEREQFDFEAFCEPSNPGTHKPAVANDQ